MDKDRTRFTNEHKPGIQARLPVTEEVARLLGYYCAEGCVVPHRGRVQAGDVVLAFGNHEVKLIEDAIYLFEAVFGIRPSISRRATSVAVSIGKASVAALFEVLAGGNSRLKRVPVPLFEARRQVVQSFIDGYVAGDGYRAPNGSVTISTVSEEWAWGVAWLVEKVVTSPQSTDIETWKRDCCWAVQSCRRQIFLLSGGIPKASKSTSTDGMTSSITCRSIQ